MNILKNSLLLISILIIAIGATSILTWLNMTKSVNYGDFSTTLLMTTETCGTLLGIITAGLMFTQGRFSQLASELTEKSPHYLFEALSLEKLQSIAVASRALDKAFTQLATSTNIAEEKQLYTRVSKKAFLMFVNLAVLLNLRLRKQGLPETGLVLSEMDSNAYRVYRKSKRKIKKEWQIFELVKQIVDVWERPSTFFIERTAVEPGLEAELKSSLAVLKMKENVDKSLADVHREVAKAADDLDREIKKISKRLHEDQILQLLPQMQQASALRGRYFFLAISFISAPILINLLVVPQLSEMSVQFLQPAVLITSVLCLLGIIFLLLYIYRILNV